ncbi:MAG: hypothetical protein U0574_12450 [Phycisphaerales bacterium]
MNAPMPLLAWIPFIQPVGQLGWAWWLLIVPLVAGTAMIWKAVRLPTLERYWAAVATMTVQVLAGMAALAAGLLILVQLVLPHLPAD